MRRLSTWLVGFALAVFVIGLTVVPLTIPAYTRLLASRTSLAQEAGLPRPEMLRIAEQVRAFVVDDEGRMLPAVVDGRAGFEDAAVSHLIDVRRVLNGARIATGVLAAALAIGLAYEVARKRTDRVAMVFYAGAVWCVALVVLSVIAAFANFDAFFSAFHGLFFKSGTWSFPSDSLLIQTFPETFWATAGATWGALILLCAAGFAAIARALDSGHRAKADAPSGRD